MSEEISKTRSPNAPAMSLEQALIAVQKLHKAIINSSVPADVAAQSLGYSGMNGAALTTLGALSAYDLIDRVKGKVSVSSMARTILHPVREEARKEALQKAALAPRIFAEINEDYHNCAPNVLENYLIHHDFTPERAKKVAAVYALNAEFANLLGPQQAPDVEGKEEHVSAKHSTTVQGDGAKDASEHNPNELRKLVPGEVTSKRMLARYTIPLGSNEATLVFTGNELSADDFDALVDFVEFSKRQFARAKSSSNTASVLPAFPREAIWKNGDHDMPVTLTGIAGEQEGIIYYQSSTGTGIPADEVEFR